MKAIQKHKLPCDVKIGHITFRKGVSLDMLVSRAERWFKDAQRLWDLEHPNARTIVIQETYGGIHRLKK